MPVMDGYTATQELRKNPAFRHLPIIAMTANAMTGDREKVIAAGMVDHIAKPLNVGQMYGTIAQWIKPSARTGRSAASAPATLSGSDSAIDALPLLPGIDIPTGLLRTMGDEKILRSILIRFRDSEHDFEQRFRSACTDTDTSAPERLAHTLRGAAGTIGAMPLYALAGKLETACGDGSTAAHIETLLHDVLSALAPVIEGLAVLAASGARKPGKVPPDTVVDPERLRRVANELHALLAYGNASAGELLDDNAELLEAAFGQQYRQIKKAIDSFDFDEALALLKNTVATSD